MTEKVEEPSSSPKSSGARREPDVASSPPGLAREEVGSTKAELRGSFASRHLGAFITAILSLAAVLVSAVQVYVAQINNARELEVTRIHIDGPTHSPSVTPCLRSTCPQD